MLESFSKKFWLAAGAATLLTHAALAQEAAPPAPASPVPAASPSPTPVALYSLDYDDQADLF